LHASADPPITVLLVEHNVPFVFSLCDQVTAMDEGRSIAEGAPDDIRVHQDVIQSYLGSVSQLDRGKPRAATERNVAGGIVLELRSVSSGYGDSLAIQQIDLQSHRGELVALFGRNGAGKSTLLNTIMGSPRAREGDVLLHGSRVTKLPTDAIVRRGIGLVPQERGIIPSQSTQDNLLLSTYGLRLSRAERASRIDEMFDRFPRLARRRYSLAAGLSGGERQMLAIAKVLVRRQQLLMCDEPSGGLAPTIIDELRSIFARLRDEGLAVLIAEQKIDWLLPIADWGYVLEQGKIVQSGSIEQLAESGRMTDAYLGGAPTAPPTPAGA